MSLPGPRPRLSAQGRTTCATDKLSALLDGDLGANEAERVRAHVTGCAACTAELAELTALRDLLRGEAAAPPAPSDAGGDGWAALAARLGPTGPSPERRRLRWRWLWAPTTALVLVLGGGAWLRQRAQAGPTDDQLIAQAEAEFRQADAQYVRALDKLRKVSLGATAGWPVERRRAFDSAQAALEAATEQCRFAARSRPADPETEELLFAAYRKQIAFFQDQLLRAQVATR
ncbi:MAG TPA: zf-HC2 domain-containing protein [Kofleriaceae bacterium]|nr:zf-HC2 domain-containing protein [Kofleriaceae bacterium]